MTLPGGGSGGGGGRGGVSGGGSSGGGPSSTGAPHLANSPAPWLGHASAATTTAASTPVIRTSSQGRPSVDSHGRLSVDSQGGGGVARTSSGGGPSIDSHGSVPPALPRAGNPAAGGDPFLPGSGSRGGYGGAQGTSDNAALEQPAASSAAAGHLSFGASSIASFGDGAQLSIVAQPLSMEGQPDASTFASMSDRPDQPQLLLGGMIPPPPLPADTATAATAAAAAAHTAAAAAPTAATAAAAAATAAPPTAATDAAAPGDDGVNGNDNGAAPDGRPKGAGHKRSGSTGSALAEADRAVLLQVQDMQGFGEFSDLAGGAGGVGPDGYARHITG